MAHIKLAPFVAALGAVIVTYEAQAHFPGRWYAEVEPFYAKVTDPLLTNSIFAVKVTDPAILGDFKEEYHLDLEGAWGCRLVAGYDWLCCANYLYGLSLEYTFYNNENSANVSNNNRSSTGLPVLAPAEFIDITDEASARFSLARTKFNQRYRTLDLLVHKNILLNNCTQIKTFAGIRYFTLREELQDHYEFVGDITGVRVTNLYDVSFKNDLTSIGPQIGTGISYSICNGFGIVGQVAGTLLCGGSKSEFYNSYYLSPSSDLGVTTQLTSKNHHDTSAHIIPALSGKVGIAYQFNLRNCSSFSVELGYQGDKYFNAANDVAYQQLLAGDDVNANNNYHDFDISGPYINVTFHS